MCYRFSDREVVYHDPFSLQVYTFLCWPEGIGGGCGVCFQLSFTSSWICILYFDFKGLFLCPSFKVHSPGLGLWFVCLLFTFLSVHSDNVRFYKDRGLSSLNCSVSLLSLTLFYEWLVYTLFSNYRFYRFIDFIYYIRMLSYRLFILLH